MGRISKGFKEGVLAAFRTVFEVMRAQATSLAGVFVFFFCSKTDPELRSLTRTCTKYSKHKI